MHIFQRGLPDVLKSMDLEKVWSSWIIQWAQSDHLSPENQRTFSTRGRQECQKVQAQKKLDFGSEDEGRKEPGKSGILEKLKMDLWPEAGKEMGISRPHPPRTGFCHQSS